MATANQPGTDTADKSQLSRHIPCAVQNTPTTSNRLHNDLRPVPGRVTLGHPIRGCAATRQPPATTCDPSWVKRGEGSKVRTMQAKMASPRDFLPTPFVDQTLESGATCYPNGATHRMPLPCGEKALDRVPVWDSLWVSAPNLLRNLGSRPSFALCKRGPR